MASLALPLNGDSSGAQTALTVVVGGHAEVVDCPAMASRREQRSEWPQAAKWIAGILATLLVAAVVSVIGFYSSFGQRMSVVETDIGWIKSAIRLNLAGQKPTSQTSVKEVSRITSELRAKGVKLDQSLVTAVGASFLNAAKQDSKSWPAVISLLDYNSFLNEETAPKFDTREQPVDPSKYHMSLSFTAFASGQAERGLIAAVRVYGKTSADKSALLDSLTEPQVTVPGYEWITVNGLGNSIGLDNARMRRVILMNAKITYSGGLVSLGDVHFVNCTFEIKPSQPSFELAESLLAAPAAHFEHLHG